MAKNHRLRTTDTVAVLAASPLLDKLTGNEVVAYIRLLRRASDEDSDTIEPRNAELAKDDRTAVRLLRALEEHGLIRIEYRREKPGRIVEVLR